MDNSKTQKARFPITLSTVFLSPLPNALERIEAEPTPINVAVPLFKKVKGIATLHAAMAFSPIIFPANIPSIKG